MTSPAAAAARPAVHQAETPTGRIVGDLWAASSVVTGGRIFDGVLVHPGHGSAHGTWPLPCTGVAPDPAATKDGSRAPATWFPPIAVWSADECSTVGNTEARAAELAGATLDYDARYRIEAHYITHVLSMPATADEDAPSGRLETIAPAEIADIHPLVLALAALEQRMRRWGHLGVVHASDVLLAVMDRLGMVHRSDGGLRTPAGNRWVFGSGYDSLDTTTLIGTGPTQIYLEDITPVVETDAQQNTIYAQREYIAAVTHTDHAIRVISA